MARVKKAMNARKKHKKVLKLAKGFIGARSKLYRPANTFVMKALKLVYLDRLRFGLSQMQELKRLVQKLRTFSLQNLTLVN